MTDIERCFATAKYATDGNAEKMKESRNDDL